MEYTFCSGKVAIPVRSAYSRMGFYYQSFLLGFSCRAFLVKVFLIEFFLLGFSCWSFIVGVFLLGFLVELLFRSSFIFRSPFISWFFYFIGQTSFIKQRRGTFFKCPPSLISSYFLFLFAATRTFLLSCSPLCSSLFHFKLSMVLMSALFQFRAACAFGVCSLPLQDCLCFLLSSRLFALRFFAVLLSSYILFLIA